MEVYCDGAYANSIDQGGAAAIFVKDNVILDKKFIGLTNTTNNRMEIFGVLIALEYILESEETEFNIYSDSQYVINTLTKSWKTKKNLDLWKRVYELIDKIKDKKINYIWVKGHNGDQFNEIADIFAVHASHISNVERDGE